jgi:hypothetical protein
MTWSIALVCEARADRDTAACLTDRVILEHYGEDKGGWISAQQLDDFRRYRGLYPDGDEFLVWKQIHSRADAKAIKPLRGTFAGYYPSHEDELNILRALHLLLFHSSKPPDGIIFLRDTDNEEERKKGLEAAREKLEKLPGAAITPIVIGVAHTKRECWHIAGFEPDRADEGRRLVEQQRLDSLRDGNDLGFDPRSCSEELTAKHDAGNDTRSAKRVLGVLTDDDFERERRCLTDLTLDELAHRGQNNGLAAFLTEVRERLLPLFGHVPPT